MDDVLAQIAKLSALAAQRADPAPLDAAGVMLRLRGLPAPMREMKDDGVLALPLGYYASASAAAAAVAVVVGAWAAAAWQEMANPFTGVEALLDLTEYVL